MRRQGVSDRPNLALPRSDLDVLMTTLDVGVIGLIECCREKIRITWISCPSPLGACDRVPLVRRVKFTSYEALGNAPLIDLSPVMSWLNVVFGVQGASYAIGVTELSTAVMLILGAFNAAASALGAAMSSVTFVITLSFFLTTRGVAEPTADGFPATSAPIGQFLRKDLVLLAASVNLLLASIRVHPK
jgi:uncharacterized membrane protein YphA (DoxX/SURF4 family)